MSLVADRVRTVRRAPDAARPSGVARARRGHGRRRGRVASGRARRVTLPRERPTRRTGARSTTDAYLRQIAATRRRVVALDPDTFTSPETYEIALTRRRRGGGRGRAGDGRRAARAPSRWCARPATTPSAIARWASASTTTSRSPPRTRGSARRGARGDRRLRRAPRQRHAAHLRGRSAGALRVDAPVPVLSRAPAPRTRSASARAPASRSTCRSKWARPTTTIGWCSSEVVLPVLEQFSRNCVLVSAGFDAHERDPLGGMRVSHRAFAAMTAELCASPTACCDGRLVAVTEGGYDLRALRDCCDDRDRRAGREARPAWPTSAGVVDAWRCGDPQTVAALAWARKSAPSRL